MLSCLMDRRKSRWTESYLRTSLDDSLSTTWPSTFSLVRKSQPADGGFTTCTMTRNHNLKSSVSTRPLNKHISLLFILCLKVHLLTKAALMKYSTASVHPLYITRGVLPWDSTPETGSPQLIQLHSPTLAFFFFFLTNSLSQNHQLDGMLFLANKVKGRMEAQGRGKNAVPA